MHTGPDPINSLFGVILKFRNFEIALFADVEAMFYQMKVPKLDIGSFRFLWAENPLQNQRTDTFQMKVHMFVTMEPPCCTNYALKSFGRDNRTESSLATVETIIKSFYADDLLKSVSTNQEAINLVWSNWQKQWHGVGLLWRVKDEDKSESFFLENSNERTLGVNWNLYKDANLFSQITVESSQCTKRNISKVVASIFDPLRFISPFVVRKGSLTKPLEIKVE